MLLTFMLQRIEATPSGKLGMQLHASCVARGGNGVLLLGPPGSGKSDMALRLIDRGFTLVADDRVDMDGDFAQAPAPLAGLLEVRGLGIVRLACSTRVRVSLVVALGTADTRLPQPGRHTELDLPLVTIDPRDTSAACRVALALDCVLGYATQLAGAFVP